MAENEKMGQTPDRPANPDDYSTGKKDLVADDGTVLSPLASILPDWDILPEQRRIIRRSERIQ